MFSFLLAVEEIPDVSFTTDANWFLENVWIIPLLPALSFFGILFFGKKMPKGGAELGIAAISASFILAIIANVAWLDLATTSIITTLSVPSRSLRTTTKRIHTMKVRSPTTRAKSPTTTKTPPRF